MICINQKSLINQYTAVNFILSWTAQTALMNYYQEKRLLLTCRNKP